MSQNQKVAGASSSKVQQREHDATRKVAGASSSRAQPGKREQDAPATLVPELRFPEFRNDWELVPLGEHAVVLKQRAGKKKYTVMSIETGVGLVSQLEKFGRDISGNSYKNYTVIQKDDFAYNKSATKPFPEGFIAKHNQDQKAAVPNSIFTCFRLTSGAIESEYLYFQLLNNSDRDKGRDRMSARADQMSQQVFAQPACARGRGGDFFFALLPKHFPRV
jgi:hypothetical protein